MVGRCLFLSQDRADIAFAVNELCHRVSDPSQHSFSKLQRLVQYLMGERPWIQVFELEEHDRSDNFLGLRLGWTQTRRNRQARGSRSWGDTFRKHVQENSRSSPEAEMYAAALGASEATGVQSMMCDWGFAVKPVLIINATATEHILHRHVESANQTRLRVRRVKSEDNRTKGRKRSALKSSENLRHPWCTLMLKRT